MTSRSRMTASPPVVVLGGEGIAVSVARGLGATGIEVYALGDGKHDPVANSRFCTHFVDLGSGDGVQNRWLEWLGGGPRTGFVFPCNDDALELVGHSRSTIADLGYSTIEADDRVLLAMLDKEQTYELARKAGVEAPATAVVESEADLEAAAARIGFPCGLKPRHTHHLQHRFGLHVKLLVANDYSELVEHWRVFSRIGVAAVVTEIIPGPDSSLSSYLSYMDAEGKPLMHFVKEKIRQYPPHFGLGCYHVSVSDQDVVDAGLRFFQGIGLRGLAYVEFKRDERDGSLKLIECNHRLGAGVELFRAAGVDLPLFVYSRALGLPTPPVSRCRTGVYLWHPVDDTRSFLAQRRSGELTFGAWARSLAHRQHFPVFRIDDPKPTIVKHWKMGRRVLRGSQMDPAALARLMPPKARPLAKRFYVRSLPAGRRRARLARRMRAQAGWCGSRGSPLYESLLEDTAADIERAGVCWELLGEREPTPYGADDALPLRFMGAVHRLVLDGRAPELVPYYPSVGGDPKRYGVHNAFRSTVAANQDALQGFVDRPVQTNEVGRVAALAPGFLVVARTTGLPLRVLELGASAGLNLRWDHYRYEAGLGWGPPTSPVRFRDVYVEGRPPFDVHATVAERRGCDLSPLDPRSAGDRLTLLSYVWPDQVERLATLRGAFEIAERVPAEVEKADAIEWAETGLATAVPDVATVVLHSFVLQYLSEAGRARLEQTVRAAGRRASSAAPLAWLRMEWGARNAEVRLATWPGNTDRLLATAGVHGRDVHWLVN